MRILVVEDDFISRRLLCRYLEPLGPCDVAINGNEALAAVHDGIHNDEIYDLICLDIMMPGLDGHATLEGIRKLEEQHGLAVGQGAKVIMTTSLEDHRTIRQAFSATADGYVIKPIEKQKFFETMVDIGLDVGVAG